MEEKEISHLLKRRLIDMEGCDYVALTRFAVASAGSPAIASTSQAIGINALADALSCSASQIYNLQKAHLLDDAVISHVGRKIVFDIDKARAAANTWKAGRDKPAEGQDS